MRKKTLLVCLFGLYACLAMAQGWPFRRMFTADDILSHSLNYDIETTSDGSVYIANIEGVLHYDNVKWQSIPLPGNTRATVVKYDSSHTVWVGGYNFFGRLKHKKNGQAYIERIGDPALFQGEVEEIWEEKGSIHFFVNNGNSYKVNGDRIETEKRLTPDTGIGMTDIIDLQALKRNAVVIKRDTLLQESVGDGMTVTGIKRHGIILSDKDGRTISQVSNLSPLSINNLTYLSYNSHGQVWGITTNGSFVIDMPSAFSQYTKEDGLDDVLCMEKFNGDMYVGTLNGIFHLKGQQVISLSSANYACWTLQSTEHGLMAATSNGIYVISENDQARHLTSATTTALLYTEEGIYSGEMEAVFLVDPSTGKKEKIADLESASKIMKDKQGTIWLQSLDGLIWNNRHGKKDFRPCQRKNTNEVARLAEIDDKMTILEATTTEPVPFSFFSYEDEKGVSWLTNSEGKGLYRWKDDSRLTDLDQYLNPFGDLIIRAIYTEGHKIWIGTPQGIIVIDTKKKDPCMETEPELVLRSVTLANDSLLWGNMGHHENPVIPSVSHKNNHLKFTFSLRYVSSVGEPQYRYHLDDGNWSTWSTDNDIEYPNLLPGGHTLYIQGKDAFGHLTEIVPVDFRVDPPFFMRWYMMILYFVLLCLLIYAIFMLRTRRLRQEKITLEKVVQERTAEISLQKDEIEEKSKNLELALQELNDTQHELIRQEKMATVGKLTQGLIDRILNPLNYINNFSKLSEGLVKDVEDNIEDDKDNMTPDNYEDTVEVLGMLRGNLQKVGEHGQNTTRTLKAMEEMLKDRSGGIVETDLSVILRQNEEMVGNYYASEIKEYHIQAIFDYPDQGLRAKVNPEQISKTIMSLLGNSIYAITKKIRHMDDTSKAYAPEIKLTAVGEGSRIQIIVHDNGTGISENIIDKIFDPFFTTKTTAEASGVGLYLSREIIQNYGGDISVNSFKGEFTDFTITLPLIKE